jgi:hypothetical protein
MRLLPARTGPEADASLLLSVPSSWPPRSSRRRCQWWRMRHRSATPSGAVNSGDVTRTIFGRGSGDPEPKDSQTVVVVGCGQHPLAACFATANAHHLRLDGVRWRSLVTEKCRNDHCRFKPGLTTVGAAS